MYLDFNSIKVRLKLISNTIIVATYFYFNSIKVRLKPAKADYASKKNKFQFHKGTIKTVEPTAVAANMYISIP